MRFINEKVFYVGVNDHEIDLFEGQYIVPNGMAYNSYVILDEKIASKDVILSVKKAVKLLKQQGAEVEYVSLDYTHLTLPTYYIISSAQVSSNLSRFDGIGYGVRAQGEDTGAIYYNTRTNGFGDEVKKRILLGNFILSSNNYEQYYLKALKISRLIKESYLNLFKRIMYES